MQALRSAVATLALAGTAMAQDTIRVKAGQPRWGANVGLSQLYVLGGPPAYDIGILYSTAIDKENRVYIFDMKETQIKAFDANGKFVGKVGQKGAGPGEYRLVMGATTTSDSILTTWDFANARVSFFTPDGKFQRSFPIPRAVTNETGRLISDAQDRLYFKALWITGADGKSVDLPAFRQQVLIMNTRGEFVDSIPMPQFAPDEPGPPWAPFRAVSSVWPSAAGGIVFGKGDTYRFTIRPLKGAPRVVEHEWAPVPLASEERAQWTEYSEAYAQRDPNHVLYEVPKVKPAYHYMFTDRDGRVWIDLFAPAEKRVVPPSDRPNPLPTVEWKQNRLYDVYDGAGSYLGRVQAPYGYALYYARGDRVWLSSMGPEGEYLLTAFRLTGIKGK